MLAFKKQLAEQIAELQAKIQLIEGDRKAFFESSQYTAKSNDQKIAELKKENKELLKKYSVSVTCDEDTINRVFKGHDVGKQSFKGKTLKQIIEILDNKKSDRIKRLHLTQYGTADKEKTLIKRLERVHEISLKAEGVYGVDKYDNTQGRKNLALSNEYEMFAVRNIEADEIEKHLSRILLKLSHESFGYEATLKGLEKAIESNKEELKGLKEMNRDAENSKEAAKAELQLQEETIQREKRLREKQRADLKKSVEIRKTHFDKLETLILRQEQNQKDMEDDFAPAPKNKDTLAYDPVETEKKISAFEQAFQKIQAATGLSNTAEAVNYFQGQTTQARKLDEQLVANANTIDQLMEKKKRLTQDYEELKFQGSEKIFDAKSNLEALKRHLEVEKNKSKSTNKRLMEIYTILVNLRSAIEHLHRKLSRVSIDLPASKVPKRDSDEYLCDLLNICELKLQHLVNQIGKDTNISTVLKEIADDEKYTNSILAKIPENNTRIDIRMGQRDSVYDDDVESGDDDDVPTRIFIKKTAAYVVESKVNRRGAANKKAPKLR